jgi:hypothetical protein
MQSSVVIRSSFVRFFLESKGQVHGGTQQVARASGTRGVGEILQAAPGGRGVTGGASELRYITDRKNLLDAATALFKRTQADVVETRQSIASKSRYNFADGEPLAEGDFATWLAEDVVGLMRENTCSPQTVWEALTDALPDVRFTVDLYDAATLVAAMLREERAVGLIEGLRLADAADAAAS